MIMKQHNIFRLFLILTAIFTLCGSSYGLDIEKKVVKTKLKNGLTVLTLERHLSPTVALYIQHHIGAVDEQKGKSGAAHLLEHMMFKGTTTIGTKNYAAEKKILDAIEKTGSMLDEEKRKGQKADAEVIAQLSGRLKELQEIQKEFIVPNEIDRLYTQNGGLDMNASTGQDLTTYHVSLPANKMELWARIESDRLLNPVFREFYTERDVVMEERRQRVETDPDGKLYEAFISTAYKTHPYGRPVLGWEEDLMNLNPSAMREIFARYRAPESIVIAVVGDINPPETLKLIEKYFGRLPKSREMKNEIPAEPLQNEERRTKVTFDASPTMMMGFHKPNPPAYEDYVFDVIQNILTTGRTSRLYKKMVTEMKVAKSVGSYNGLPASRYPNLFVISAEPNYPHTNAEIEETILQELEKLKNTPVADEELMKAKNNIKMEYIQSLNSNGEIASLLSYYEVLLGDYRYLDNYLKNIDRVTAEDIRKAAENYMSKNNRTIAVLEKNKD